MSPHPTDAVAANIELVARLDIAGGGQVVVQDGLAFVGHMDAPHGTTIIDVSTPSRPKIIKEIKLEDTLSHTHKVRVAGNLMITNVEQAQRHLLRRGAALPTVMAELEKSLKRSPSEEEIATALDIPVGKLDDVRAFLKNGYHEGGFRVWDISDPANPELLSYVKTH